MLLARAERSGGWAVNGEGFRCPSWEIAETRRGAKEGGGEDEVGGDVGGEDGGEDGRKGRGKGKTAGRLRFLINLVYFGVLIVLTALAVRYLLLWMMPFVFAFLTAALLQRPLKWLARTTRVSKKVYSVMLVVLLVLLLAAAVGFAGSRLVIGAAGFLSDEGNIRLIENTVRSVSAAIQELINRYPFRCRRKRWRRWAGWCAA